MTDGGNSNASEERKVFGLQVPRLHVVPIEGTPIDYEDNYTGRHPRLHRLAVRFTSPTQVTDRRLTTCRLHVVAGRSLTPSSVAR